MNLVAKKKFLGSQIKTSHYPEEDKELLQNGKLNPAGIYTSTYNRTFNQNPSSSIFQRSTQESSPKSNSSNLLALDADKIRKMSQVFSQSNLKFQKQNSLSTKRRPNNNKLEKLLRQNKRQLSYQQQSAQALQTQPDYENEGIYSHNSLYGTNEYYRSIKTLRSNPINRSAMVSLDSSKKKIKLPKLKAHMTPQLSAKNSNDRQEYYHSMGNSYRNTDKDIYQDQIEVNEDKIKEILSIDSLEAEQLKQNSNKKKKKQQNIKNLNKSYEGQNDDTILNQLNSSKINDSILYTEETLPANTSKILPTDSILIQDEEDQQQQQKQVIHCINKEKKHAPLEIPSDEDLINLIPEEFLRSSNFNLERFIADNHEYVLHLLGQCSCKKCSCGACKCPSKPKLPNGFMNSTYTQSYMTKTHSSSSDMHSIPSDLRDNLSVRLPQLKQSPFYQTSYKNDYIVKEMDFFRAKAPETKYNGQFSSLSSYNSQFMNWKDYSKQNHKGHKDNIPLPPRKFTKKYFQSIYNGQYQNQDIEVVQDKQAERSKLKILPMEQKSLIDKSHKKYEDQLAKEQKVRFNDQLKQIEEQHLLEDEQLMKEKKQQLKKLEEEHKNIKMDHHYKSAHRNEYRGEKQNEACPSKNLQKDLQSRIIRKLEQLKLEKQRKDKIQLDKEIETAIQSKESLGV